MTISQDNSIPLIIKSRSVINSRSSNDKGEQSKKTLTEFNYIGINGIYLIILLFTLPFLFGGRDPLVASVIKIIFFSGILLKALYSIFIKDNTDIQERLTSNKVVFLFTPFLVYLTFQILPLPLSLLAIISSESEKAYHQTGAEFGYISIDPLSSLEALGWIFLFVLLLNSLLNVSYKTLNIDKKRRKSKSTKIVYFSENSLEYDMFSELIQVTLIRVSLICAFIGVSHLVLQMNSLFGLYSYSENVEITSRAHWPFVNANQLAFVLEIGLLLCVTRFLRERQIKGLSLVTTEDKSLLMIIKDFFSLIERQASLLISIFLLSIGLFLTMSRAGIILSIMGIGILWFFYQLKPVRLINKKSSSMNQKRSSGIKLIPNLLKFLKLIFLPTFLIITVLLFIGGEATHDLTERVDETYIQHGSAPRAALNTISWEVFSENPIFGVGLNNWRLAADQFSKGYVIGWKLDYAHNDYLQLLSEVGLIGLLLIMPPLFYLVRKSLKFSKINLGQVRRSFLLGLFISFIVPVVHAVVDFPFHLPMLSFAIFSTLLVLVRANIYFMLQHEISLKK